VNQAAINYHFGSKENLYKEALRSNFAHITALDETAPTLPLPALGTSEIADFMQVLMRPAILPEALQLHSRLLAWEMISPSGLLEGLLSDELGQHLQRVATPLRQYLPEQAPEEQLTLTVMWLLSQGLFFHQVRNIFARRHPDCVIDEGFMDNVSRYLGQLALGGLKNLKAVPFSPAGQ